MAMANKKAPKSRKVDGKPKKRWSAAERAAKGVAPRKGGGHRPYEGSRPYVDRKDGAAGDDRAPRSDSGRDDRAPRSTTSRDDRGSFDRRGPGSDRPAYGRSASSDRRDSGSTGRPSFDRRDSGSTGRPSFDRRDSGSTGRPSFDRRDSGSSDRRDSGSTGRPSFGRRDSGSSFSSDRRSEDRGRYQDRNTSSERPTFQERNERPRYQDRNTSSDRGFQSRGRDDRSRSDDRGPRRTDDRDSRGSERPRHFASEGGRGERRGPSGDFRDRAFQPRRDNHHDRGGSNSDHNAEADQMSWTARDVVDVEVSAAHQASGFAELGVALPLVAQLSTKGITEPFPIQSATIVDGIAGRDVLGRGRTGSGKTLAFGLSMLTRLADGKASGSPRAMIITPTRELALQIADDLSPLASTLGLHLTLITGGMSYIPQARAFERGVDIVVATPGRLIDLLEQGTADLSQVEITVLDEADHMSDLGFMPAVTTLLEAVPSDGQRMLFSATLDHQVDRLVRKFLHDAVTHEVDSSKNAVTTLTHHMLQLAPHHKNPITAEIANRDGKTVIFARTQMGVERIAGQLREVGVMAGGLHGGLTQGARARVLAAFKGDDLPVLVATDVAARGIHVDDVSLVLQVDPPMNSKDYLHRAGRTARAGETGAVVSIVLPHQRKEMRRISGQAGVHVAPLDVAPGSVDLRESTGARVPSGTPIAESDYQRLIAPKQQPRRPQSRGNSGGGGGFRKRQGGGGGGRNRTWK
ncbi:DEAD/DEAH box helicase [Tessaracoccus antarcticus]|uniref:DEAD/DEAH box helicase n=2 Tax=Tessaracoccus antarcticus TaxID=2479848 RepID=A0A3M0G165_9ACTN|nr:DEAD/DEAH box helicase [Tessaracoccus antarcticus]